jgi:hypothetical protein
MDNFENFFVGAYATSPTLFTWNEEKEKEFISSIKNNLNIRGLELPFWGELHEHNEEFFLSLLDPKWEYVLTCLPGTMKSLELNPHFGIASDDEKSRLQAIAFYKKANKALVKLNSYFGKQKVISVAMASAPSLKIDGVSSSSKSLAKSLGEIASWDWFGAKLVIEHCDSGRESNPVKGFLSIEEEIEAILEVNNKLENTIGLTINWARSAIETRSEHGPIIHVKKAYENKILSGMMFSGTSPKCESYGDWSDLHLPVSKENDISYYEKDSLMTLENMKNTLYGSDIESLSYIGVKVLSMPIEQSSIEKRIGINNDTMKILNKVIKDLENE